MKIIAKLKATRKTLKDWQKDLPKLSATIENTKLVIQFIDLLEEHRDMEIQEWNFRDLLQTHLINLLNCQRTYWKQRGANNGSLVEMLAQKNHANSTIGHRQNLIPSLQDGAGNTFQGHEEKAKLLWDPHKQRLGSTEFSHMYFDRHSLLTPAENLEILEEPFTKEEIDSIIQQLPTYKSPGPNGFNGDFLKKCWPTLAADFYDLCQGFFDGNICMQSINTSHIVLVPKKDNPTKIDDFRLISLLNSSVKLLTKILANRLQKIILRIIHGN
jgi:hypothetical protein